MNRKTNQRKTLRKLYDWHAWVGFQLAILMFTILATGTIATVSNEIDWFIFDEMRSYSVPENPQKLADKDWQDMYKAIKLAYPKGRIKTIDSMGSDYFTFRARVELVPEKDRYVHVDQWTKQVTGDISLLTVQRFFRDFHRYLFMPAFPGLPIVTFFAFILCISLYSGLKTTRNWKTALWRFRIRQGARILLSDVHKVFGLWGIWFISIIIVTSFWYLFEFGAAVSGKRLEPPSAKVTVMTQFEGNNFISNEQFLKAFGIAKKTLPNWQITAVQFPSNNTGVLRFKGVGKNPLLRDRAYKVELHPLTLEVLNSHYPATMSTTNYLNEYADPLHFGYFGGLLTKLIWFVFGLALTGLSVTGVMMTYKRTKLQSVTRVQYATLPILLLALVYFYFWLSRYM